MSIQDDGSATAPRSPWRTVAYTLLLLYAPMCLWLCYPVTGLGGWAPQGVELFFVLPVCGVSLILLSGPMALFAYTRERAGDYVRMGACLLLGFLPFAWIGGRVRMHAFSLAGERAMPLVHAVERYVEVRGRPPSQLEELVPKWLDRLPDRLPPIEVVTGDHLSGNPWMLIADVPTGFLNFDQFVYMPDQSYDGRGWGGRFQRLGRWGYLHE